MKTSKISILVSTIASLILCASCNSTSSTVQSDAPQYHLPDQITLTDVSAVRDPDDGTIIQGTTNLQDGTKLGVELMNGNIPKA